jgi:hypothetical protein
MANRKPDVWTQHPNLHATVAELIARGVKNGDLPLELAAKTGVSVSRYRIEKHIASCEGCSQVEVLLTPVGGYAVPERISIKREHPKGWEPHVAIEGDEGELVSAVTENADPERDSLLLGSDLDPSEWEIVGDLSFNKWQGMVPVQEDSSDCKCEPRQAVKHHEMRWQFQYKAKLRRFNATRRAEIEALCEEIRTHTPNPARDKALTGVHVALPKGDDATVICIADTQAGKRDGDGTKGMTRRFLSAIDGFVDHVEWLRFKGRARGPLYILGLGDLIENCDGHYAMQAANVELNLMDQVNLMRRLLMKSIERWAPMFERVVVAAVPGNHGENRRDGKAFTDFGDNHDLAIFHQLQDVFSFNPAAYGHVSFAIPKDSLAMTLEMGGEIVGMTHGHITGKARAKLSSKINETGSAAKKVLDWWAMQAHGQQPVGDARILFTGHYHHLLVTEAGRKTHVQVPALDGGSDWWRNQSGQDARPGMLTCRVGKNVSESGLGSLEVL